MNAYIPPFQHVGLENFACWDNFLSDDDINRLLALKEWHMKKDAQIGIGSGGTVEKNIRSSQISWMFRNPETDWFWDKISQVIAEVNSRFFHFDLTGCYEGAQLTSYNADIQEHYSWHNDCSVTDRMVPRKLSMSLLLSHVSDFQGGDLEILTHGDKSSTLKQERGRAWFFPSYTIHRVSPVTQGMRRSLVLWIGGPSFR